MGKKGKKRISSVEEDKENRKLRRKIRRLEEKLDRVKEERRKRSLSRSSSRSSLSRRRSPAGYSSWHSQYRGRSPSRYSSKRSPARSSSSYSSTRRSRSRSRAPSRSLSRYTTSSTREVLGVDRTSQNDTLANHNSSVDDGATQALGVASGGPPDHTVSGAARTSSSNDDSQTIPEHEIELQQEILSVIGARLESDKKTATAVHKDVALRWSEILKKGLPPDEVKSLLEKYPVPENCVFISVPKLNAEITAAVQESAIKRDKRIVEKQERIASCLGAVGKAISITLKMDDPRKLELLENLSDGGRLLASIHREESLARKSIILANLNLSMKTTLSNTSVDEWLFGVDLEEKIKSAKNLEKTSKVLKPPTKPLQQSYSHRIAKNPKGPPRQSSYKSRTASSGGQRKSSSSNSDARKPFQRKEPTRQFGKRR